MIHYCSLTTDQIRCIKEGLESLDLSDYSESEQANITYLIEYFKFKLAEEEHPSLRPIMLFLWIAITAVSILACLWKLERNVEGELMVEHLLNMGEKLDVVIILSLVIVAVMLGLN
jgi:hypothetical protein